VNPKVHERQIGSAKWPVFIIDPLSSGEAHRVHSYVASLKRRPDMKMMTNLITFTATALLMGGSAMAQNLTFANVPFDFQFGGVTLPAGAYRVDTSRASVNGLILIRNQETRKGALSIAIPGDIRRDDYNKPRLLFRCSASGCILNEVRTPYDEYVYPVKSSGKQHLASVALTTKAD
jgi:hypothetical protein